MKLSTAIGIVANIDSEEFSSLQKGEAIYEVIKMPTHNSVTKEMMLKVIKWLWNLVFEFEDGETQ